MKTVNYLFIIFIVLHTACTKPLKGNRMKSLNNTAFTFKKDSLFSITQLKKANDYPSSDKDTSYCSGWSLNEREIREIIQSAETISSMDWHYQFDHLPCTIEGVIKQGLNEYSLSVNGGSWFTIGTTDTTFTFGSFKETNNKYFLSSAWVDEMD